MADHPNADLIRKAIEDMSAGEIEQLAAVFAENIEYHQIGEPTIEGKAALVESMQGFEDIDFGVEIHDVLANDDHTIALLEVTVNAGGETFNYRTAEIYHIEDGKIAQRWAFSDNTGAITEFFAQLAGG
jgi:ketosteroid isomerase-like protein